MCTIPAVSPASRYDAGQALAERNGDNAPSAVREDIIRAATRVFSDRGYHAASMAGWGAVTSRGLTVHTLPGGHFFPQRHLAALTALIVDEWAVARSGK